MEKLGLNNTISALQKDPPADLYELALMCSRKIFTGPKCWCKTRIYLIVLRDPLQGWWKWEQAPWIQCLTHSRWKHHCEHLQHKVMLTTPPFFPSVVGCFWTEKWHFFIRWNMWLLCIKRICQKRTLHGLTFGFFWKHKYVEDYYLSCFRNENIMDDSMQWSSDFRNIYLICP